MVGKFLGKCFWMSTEKLPKFIFRLKFFEKTSEKLEE